VRISSSWTPRFAEVAPYRACARALAALTSDPKCLTPASVFRHFLSMARKHRKLPGKKGIPGTRTYIRVVRLGKWFPARDPPAGSMARLMILREDFMLELRGIHARSIPLLDVHSNIWRQMYFFRSSVRTLWEIQGTLTTIRTNREFKRILQRRPQSEQNQIKRISSKLNAAASLTREIRNAMGGHVLPEAVTRALDTRS